MRRRTSRGTMPASSQKMPVRAHLLLDEAAHLCAQHTVFLCEIDILRHCPSPSSFTMARHRAHLDRVA